MNQRCLIAGSVLCLALVACSKGNVVVSGSPAPASGTLPSAPPTRSDGPVVSGGNPGGPNEDARKVFFERVLADDGLPQSVIAVSFLPQSGLGSAPFGAVLRVPQDFGPHPIFVPGQTQVTYLRSTGIGADSLVSTDLSNWKAQPLFAFPRLVADFALESTQGLLAWAGRDGSLSVTKLEGAAPRIQSIALNGYRAQSVSWNSAGTRLLMRSNQDAWVFAESGAGWAQESYYKDVAAAAFSPSGDQLAVVGRANRTLRILGLGQENASFGSRESREPRAVLESSEIYDFGWSASQGFIYWVRLGNGQQEIRMLGAAAGAETALVRLSVPAAIQGGVVCPGWVGGSTLYFSDYVDGEYVVERLSAADAAVGRRPAVFAQPPANDEGYVCPKGALN